MRILMVAESFVPHLSGVTTSLLHSARILRERGHEIMFLAPSGRGFRPSDWSPTILPRLPRAPETLAEESPADVARPGGSTASTCPVALAPGQWHEEVIGIPTVRLPSFPMAGYPSLRLSMGTVSAVRRVMADFRPDVVHVASPFVLGARAVTAAKELGIPSVAAYQTDVAAYTHRYGMPWLESAVNRRIASIHREATLTVAPSRSSVDYLESIGVPRVVIWGRGVDARLFHPSRRSEEIRRGLGVNPGETLVGFVGRLASEKQIDDLRVVQSLPGVRLVIIGKGPERDRLRTVLHRAQFLGQLTGEDLAAHVASLDVFVHPGQFETFGQTIQEAMAAGVATVAVGSGGPLDIIEDRVTGRLYRPGQLGELRSVVKALRDPEARAGLAVTGHRAMQSRSWVSTTVGLESQYLRAIDMHRPAAAGRGLGPSRAGTRRKRVQAAS